MNSVILIGRLAREPELQYTPNTQTAVCRFTLAVDRPRRNGEDAGADFFRITVFGRQAENCDRYLAKGRQAAVTGRAETGSYKNRDGVTVNTFDIIASNVEFLGGAQDAGSGGNSGRRDDYRGGNNNYPQQGGRQPQQSYQAPREQSYDFRGFDDLPDTFSSAEDDIPF